MSTRSRLSVALASTMALAVALAGVELSGADFSAESVNRSNRFEAASSFNFRVGSGTYTGDGAPGHQITGLGFWPNLVIIKGHDAGIAVARSSTMAATKPLAGAAASSAGMITGLFNGGFSLGVSDRVNGNGLSYTWVAFATSPGRMTARSYVGNGSAVGGRSITGLGYSPEYVIVLPANNGNAVMRASGMTTSFRFDGNDGAANQINSLDADGFTVGAGLNASNVTYHCLAFNETAGLIDLSSYTGNGTGQSIAGVGFQPDYALVRPTSTTAARAAVHRPAASTGTTSLRFDAAVNDTDAITALEADGIQVGANTDANATGDPYALMSFKDEGP